MDGYVRVRPAGPDVPSINRVPLNAPLKRACCRHSRPKNIHPFPVLHFLPYNLFAKISSQPTNPSIQVLTKRSFLKHTTLLLPQIDTNCPKWLAHSSSVVTGRCKLPLPSLACDLGISAKTPQNCSLSVFQELSGTDDGLSNLLGTGRPRPSRRLSTT